MTAAALPAAILPRVAQLLRLIGSPVDSEVVAACRALGRTLAGVGADFHTLADAVEHPPGAAVSVERQPARKRREARPGDVVLDAGQRARLAVALDHALDGARLSPWERTFAHSILGRLRVGRGRLSERQDETLARLLDTLGEGSAWA